MATGLCHNWNAKLGPCAWKKGACSLGLRHGICNVCGVSGHRAIDFHGDGGKDKGKGKHKGKFKGKKGKKGEKGENKD